MPNQHGDFIWYELMTSDADAAQSFYGKILGWTFKDSGQKDIDYRWISAGDQGVGGFLSLTDDMTADGAQPCWLGYINVDDVDATAQSVKNAGGSIHKAPWDIPEAGRLALVADPQGALFCIMKPSPPAGGGDTTSTAFAATEPKVGHCAWNELSTTDPEAAKPFYCDLFGWKKTDEMDMGPMGNYEMLSTQNHAENFMVGGVMTKPEEMPVTAWCYYFRVVDIDAAVQAITAAGGTLLMEPMEIPGGEFSLSAMDPQGAAFALIGPRN